MTAAALLAIALLVALNGFFVAAEFALVSVRPDQLPSGRAAARVRQQTAHLDEYLSACQLGITIASLALGALGEPTIASLLEPLLGSLADLGAVLATVLALLVMTALHITIGEQAPKSFAIGSAGRVAMLCSLTIEVFYRALRPLVRVLNAAANRVVRLAGGTPAASHAESASLDELRRLIGAVSASELDATDRQLLEGVFTLDERTAADVMTPRHRLVTMHAWETVELALGKTRHSGHSRFPLLDDAKRLTGVVLLRDLTDALLDGKRDTRIAELGREMLVTPSGQRLDVLLERLRDQRASIAAVADEYGELEGVVTVEDIVEELIGEIWDENDRQMRIRRLAEGAVIVNGDAALHDLGQHGIALGPATSTSIGGLVQERLGRVPVRGDRIVLDEHVLEVRSMDGTRVRRVLIAPGQAASQPPSTAST